ncbi:hypothetical protein AC578_7071 [Pseudocercospora eumusae]|uniref:Uncharacterized protein n=1 Tax=Pseudocercospora eumusae TaxID=321146 RepID=A0A139HFQ9_9PEZI|nr:hypothetical protein AC578_7071 [Pseudocercospora eumusae]
MLSFEKQRTSIDGSTDDSVENLLGQKAHHRKRPNLKDTIDLVQLAFVNPIQPSANRERLEIWRDFSTPDYGGPPSPEVDSAWAELLKKVTFNISLTDEVAKPALGNTYEFEGSVTIGIEVYHALHCLDILRVMLYPDYYKDNPILNEPLDETQLHRSHCLDYLRQYVQCNVDLTPMYWYKVPNYDKLLLRPGTIHTCLDRGPHVLWKDLKFGPPIQRHNVTSFEVERLMQSWGELVPLGMGFIPVQHPHKYNLPPPLRFREGQQRPGPDTYYYSISVFHQLHCLDGILRSWLNDGMNKDHHSNLDTPRNHAHDDEHIMHCFDYLRQTIMCTGDTALEGADPDAVALGLDTLEHGTSGLATTHICKNFDAIFKYAERNAPLDAVPLPSKIPGKR